MEKFVNIQSEEFHSLQHPIDFQHPLLNSQKFLPRKEYPRNLRTYRVRLFSATRATPFTLITLVPRGS